MPGTVCIVTGPVVGLRSTWFLEDTVSYAERIGKDIVVFDLLREVLHQSGTDGGDAYEQSVRLGELIDGYEYQFELMRQRAYLSIARKVDALPDTTHVIVRAPASLLWKGITMEFKDHGIIAETLHPDRFITMIDAEWNIERNLGTDYGAHALRVFAHQEAMTIPRILDWLNAEVSRTEDWAEWASHLTGRDVRHFVMGIRTPSIHDRSRFVRDVDNMVKFATDRDLVTFYASYSMTVGDEDVRDEISGMIWRLRDYGAVIDPGTIEIEGNVGDDRDVVNAYTVLRDLKWDVKKVDIVTAFHPYKHRPPLSTGMMDELGHARAYRKERYLVLPTGSGSPFTGGNYVPSDHVFDDGESLFRWFEEDRDPNLEPRFKEWTSSFGSWQEERLRSPTGTG